MKIALIAHITSDLHIHSTDMLLAIGLFAAALISVVAWRRSK